MLMRAATEIIFRFFIYTLFLTGVWLLVNPVLLPTYKSFRFFKGIRHAGTFGLESINTQGNKNFFYKHCDMLLQATWKWHKPGTTILFFIISLSSLIASLPIYYQVTKVWILSFIFSISTALLPYIFLRVRLEIIRSNTSHQLVPAVSLLTASYRVSGKDIYFSIMRSIEKLENNTLQKSFIILAKSIQCHQNISEIDEAIALFVFKIQTSWAKQLGVLISSAVIDGRDIEQSLANIVKDMKQGQQIIEEEKSNSHDTAIMGYFPLLAFPLTTLFLQYISGRFKVLYFQFKTTQGLTSFIITLLICLTGFIIATVFRNPRNDL